MKTSHKRKTYQPSKLRSILEILLVIGLILIIPLFFVLQIQANPLNTSALNLNMTGTPYATFTAQPGGFRAPGGIPVTPPVNVAPAPSFVTTAKEPPACTFPLAQTATAETTAANYTFSEPKVVPLDPSWDTISLFQWLPDNQQILIAYSDDMQSSNVQQTIGLLNPQTGQSQDYGTRFAPASARPPVWIPSLNGVVYPESQVLTSTAFSKNGIGPAISPSSAVFHRWLWLSRGDPTQVQAIVDDQVTVTANSPSKFGEQLIDALSPDGNQIVYLDSVGKKLYKQKVAQGSFEPDTSPAFDATHWTYHKPDGSTEQNWWYMTWRPNSTQVFLYNYPASLGYSYTFLLDVQKGDICELSLWKDDPNDWRKSWVGMAHWSPNGRYLAVLRSKGLAPTDFSDLLVLDTTTGQLYQIEPTTLSPLGMETLGKYYISDVAWAPDNHHLAAISQVDYYSSKSNSLDIEDGLFLLDFLNGQSTQIAPAKPGSNMDWPNDTLLWSEDGSQLIDICPDGLCLLSVQKQIQP